MHLGLSSVRVWVVGVVLGGAVGCSGNDDAGETDDAQDSTGGSHELPIEFPAMTGGSTTGGSSTGGAGTGGGSSGGTASGGESAADGSGSATGGSDGEDDRPPLEPVPEPEGWLEAAPSCVGDGTFGGQFESVIVVNGVTEEIVIEDADGFSSGLGRFSSSGVELEWENLVAFGETEPVSRGTYTFPSTSEHAAKYPGTLCVTAGYAGYDVEKVFKFNILGLNSAEDCSGEDIQADILGCWD